MATLVLEGLAATVEWYPPTRPASVTASLYDSSGNQLASSLTTTVDAYQGIIGSVTTDNVFAVSNVAVTPAVGRRYWYVSASTGAHESMVRLGELAAGVWTLESTPATSAVSSSDLLRGARCTASLTSTHTGNRGTNFRLVWTVTPVTGSIAKYTQIVHVVAQFFRDPILADEAARYLSHAFPGRSAVANAGYFRELAERSSERVARKLRSTERWPWLVGDQEVFRDCGIVALRIELALEGLIPAGHDAGQYRRQQEDELDKQFQEAVAQLWVDDNDNGAQDVGETSWRGNVSMVRA